MSKESEEIEVEIHVSASTDKKVLQITLASEQEMEPEDWHDVLVHAAQQIRDEGYEFYLKNNSSANYN